MYKLLELIRKEPYRLYIQTPPFHYFCDAAECDEHADIRASLTDKEQKSITYDVCSKHVEEAFVMLFVNKEHTT